MSNISNNEPLPPLEGIRLVLVTIAISLTTFMEVLDTTIVNVSIPHIAGSLGASASQGTWTISAYTLASAIVVPLTGWIAKRFGEVKIFVLATILFTLMSFLCGLAHSLSTLVVFRFFQGFFSGPMVPLSQTLLLSSYAPEKKGLALAFFVMTVVVAPVFGPVLGGWLTDTFEWPWIFYINVPIGIISSILSYFLLRSRESKSIKLPIDYVGLILLFIGVGALQLVLDNGNERDWFNSRIIVVLSVIAFIGICLFLIWETTEKQPIVDLSLLKNRNFLVSLISMCLGMFCFFGGTVVFPLWLQTVKGYTATWSGLASAPLGILPFFLSPIVGLLVPKVNLRLMISVAFGIFSITMFWFGTFNMDSSFQQLIVPRFLQGLGVSLFFIPLNQIMLSNVTPDKIAAATSLSNFFRSLSTSFATAIITFSWTRLSTLNHAYLTEKVTSSSVGTQDYLNTLSVIGLTDTTAYSYIDQIINTQAYTMSTNYIFNTMGCVFIFLVIIIWFAKPPFNNNANAGGGH